MKRIIFLTIIIFFFSSSSYAKSVEALIVKNHRKKIVFLDQKLDYLLSVIGYNDNATEDRELIISDGKPDNIEYSFVSDFQLDHIDSQAFFDAYTEMNGVLTFRGNHYRNSAAFGTISSHSPKLTKMWEYTTGRSPNWGGGMGWTGQSAIIQWEEDVREMMNLKEEFKYKKDFVEVISATLSGKIYFTDLYTGELTREPIDIKNPIKGSVSLDPRGYPLLYVGQGVPEQGSIGYRIYSLIDGNLLYFIPGIDPYAYRGWGAFDSAPLINRETDSLFLGGENGLFYYLKLNTLFNRESKEIAINPDVLKYRYKVKGNGYQGIENSVAMYKNIAYFADNGGSIQAVDAMTMKPIWSLEKTDDTDATIVIEVENGVPYLYTGTEVDIQGTNGVSLIRKLNGLTGEAAWQKEIPAFSLLGERPVNGGLLATPVIGKGNISDIVIFTISRYKTFNGGLIIALDKENGNEVWRKETSNYSWSSAVDVYNESGNGFIVQGDSAGNLYILDGENGEQLSNINLGSNIEASPVVFNDRLIVGTRGGQIVSVKIE